MLGESTPTPTPTPTDADPAGEWYCIERGARKDTGDDGRAEVWRRGCFAWEYKGSAPTSMRRSTSCGRCGRSGPDHL